VFVDVVAVVRENEVDLAKIKNRIIGSGEEQLDQIMFNPRNWRIHPLSQQDALKGVLEEVGWVQQVIVNKRTGNLIDGHLRCQLAAREGAQTIPVVYVDVSEDEEALVLATLDPIAAMAATDKQKLEELFQDINSDNENVQKMISEIAENNGLFDLPSLDELGDKYGETNERDFWPVVRVQVSPETMTKFKAIMDSMPGDDEAEKFDALVSREL
jgi:hypothetical protein